MTVTMCKLLGPPLIWALSITAFSRWVGAYCSWWCHWTIEGSTDLSFWSAVVSLAVFVAAVFAVDGLAWAVGRWKR